MERGREKRKSFWASVLESTVIIVAVAVVVFLIGGVIGFSAKEASYKNNVRCVGGYSEILLVNVDKSSTWYRTEHVCGGVRAEKGE